MPQCSIATHTNNSGLGRGTWLVHTLQRIRILNSIQLDHFYPTWLQLLHPSIRWRFLSDSHCGDQLCLVLCSSHNHIHAPNQIVNCCIQDTWHQRITEALSYLWTSVLFTFLDWSCSPSCPSQAGIAPWCCPAFVDKLPPVLVWNLFEFYTIISLSHLPLKLFQFFLFTSSVNWKEPACALWTAPASSCTAAFSQNSTVCLRLHTRVDWLWLCLHTRGIKV